METGAMAPVSPRSWRCGYDERAVRSADRCGPDGMVQRPAETAGAVAATAASGDPGTGRAGRPRAAVPDGVDRAGDVGGQGSRDPRSGHRRLPVVAADALVPCGPPRGGTRYAGAH